MEKSKQLEDIDFEVLGDLNKVSSSSILSRNIFYVFVIAILLLVALGVIYSMMFFVSFFVISISIPIFLFIYIVKLIKNENSFDKGWKRFVAKNNLNEISENNYSYVPPSVYQKSGTLITSVVRVDLYPKPLVFGIYRTQEGSSDESYINKMIIYNLALNRIFPHLIIMSKNNVTKLNRGNATESYKAEGNFSDNFYIFHQEDQHIDVLSVLSPDILLSISDFSGDVIIEIIQNNMYFAFRDEFTTKESIKNSMIYVNKISNEIYQKEKTINFLPLVDEESISIKSKNLESDNINATNKVMVDKYVKIAGLVIIATGMVFVLFILSIILTVFVI